MLDFKSKLKMLNSEIKARISYCVIFPLISVFFAGCNGPTLIKYSLKTPATVLHPLGQAPVSDGRVRFREILCDLNKDHGSSFPDARSCDSILLRLDDEPLSKPLEAQKTVLRDNLNEPTTIVFVPGIFGECVENIVTPFADSYAHLQSLGYIVKTISISGRSSSEVNAPIIKDALYSINANKIIIVAYSKGVPDVLEMFRMFPDTIRQVTALVSIAGVVSGTPIADGFLNGYEKVLSKIPAQKCPPGDGSGIRSITRQVRMKALAENKLPKSIDLYSLVSFASPDRISAPLLFSYKILSKVDPRNDGQVIFHDAVLPGSTLLGYVNADHWAVALPFNRSNEPWRSLINHNDFPREIVIESVMNFINENQQLKQ